MRRQTGGIFNFHSGEIGWFSLAAVQRVGAHPIPTAGCAKRQFQSFTDFSHLDQRNIALQQAACQPAFRPGNSAGMRNSKLQVMAHQFQITALQNQAAVQPALLAHPAGLKPEYARKNTGKSLGILKAVIQSNIDQAPAGAQQLIDRSRQAPADQVIIGGVMNTLVEQADEMKKRIAAGDSHIFHANILTQVLLDEIQGRIDGGDSFFHLLQDGLHGNVCGQFGFSDALQPFITLVIDLKEKG